MPGYRGQSFEQRARSLHPQDLSAVKDFFVAIGAAVDKLEGGKATPPPADNDNSPEPGESN